MTEQWIIDFVKAHPSQVRVNIEIAVVSEPINPSPTQPQMPFVGKGNTVTLGDGTMAIRYPFTMPPDTDTDVVKRTFCWIETPTGGTPGAKQTLDFTTANATGTFDVQNGSAVDYWCNETDGAGNVSPDSPHGAIASASDTVPPGAPATPGVGPGNTAPAAPMLKKGQKV